MVGNLFCRFCCLIGKVLHLGGHDGKPFTRLTRTGRLDCRVECKKVCLFGDLLDQLYNRANLVSGIPKREHLCFRLLRGRLRIDSQLGGQGNLLGNFPDSGRKLGGCRCNRFHALCHTCGRLTHRGCLSAVFLSTLRHVPGCFRQLGGRGSQCGDHFTDRGFNVVGHIGKVLLFLLFSLNARAFLICLDGFGLLAGLPKHVHGSCHGTDLVVSVRSIDSNLIRPL